MISEPINLADGRTLNALSCGPRPPVMVLLHGIGDCAAIWQPFMRALHWRAGIVAMDLPGHGDSCSLPQSGLRVADIAHSVARAMPRLGVEAPILVGHSLGAQVAIHLAACFLPDTSALVLVDGGPYTSASAASVIREGLRTAPRRFASAAAFAAILRARLPLADPKVLEELAPHGLRRVSADTLELKYGAEVVDSLALSSDVELATCLVQVTCPTLVVRGAWSSVLSAAGARSIRQCLASGAQAEVMGAGHGVPLENPIGLAAEVERFLQQSANGKVGRRGY